MEEGSSRNVLRIGTRGSALALAQSRQTAARLEESGQPVELVVVRTSGDKMADIPLAKIGGKGLFIKELEEALERREIDAAIHSMKDVPADLPPGFVIAAVAERADERDVLVFPEDLEPGGVRSFDGDESLGELAEGARIGTGSLRRRAQIAARRSDVFESADLIVKVKEPQLEECARLERGQTLFTYLHLAADRPQALALVDGGATEIAYETVTAPDGTLPLLTPMSEVAGRLSVQAGAYALQKANGGRGVLLGGVPGVAPGHVLIIGGGVSGTNAAEMAIGLGAQVTIGVLVRNLSGRHLGSGGAAQEGAWVDEGGRLCVIQEVVPPIG